MPDPIPELDRELIIFLYIGLGLTRSQIAFLLDIPRNTVSSRIFRLGIGHKGPRSPRRQLPHPLISKEL